MQSLIQGIVKAHLKELSDGDLATLATDCEEQERINLYGDEKIDKPDWLRWRDAVNAEVDRRTGASNED